ncbi:MAG: hypothetical protein J6V72_11075 [Kiritimatiellae bacterium]|nr:hypothetical protein [Kiritimatiellia bacterium]
MRRVFLAVLTAKLCLASHTAFAIAASQAWTMHYVSNYVSGVAASVQAGTTVVETNGSTVITANGGTAKEVRLVVEDFADAALLVTNALPAAGSITNGALFVWNGARDYISPLGVISATPSNFVWSGVSSFPTNGLDRFEGYFDVRGALVQPSLSHSITNGMEVANE